MSVQTGVVDLARYTVQYELLRTQFVGTPRDVTTQRGETELPRGIGLALLLREGMPGWLKAVEGVMRASCATVLRHDDAPPEIGSPAPNTAMPMSSAQRHDITTILASLALSTRRLTGLSPNEGYNPCQ